MNCDINAIQKENWSLKYNSLTSIASQTVFKCFLNSTRILNKYRPLASGITINRTFTKTFASLFKETIIFLVTRIICNE